MRRHLASIITLVLLVPTVRADGYTFDDLICRSWCELDAIYRAASPGTAPCGFHRGHVVFRDDDFLAGPRSKLNNYAWQGKHFFGDSLINQFRGVKMIQAKVFGDSWLDGKPALILDYRHTSLLWMDVRDEMREVSPGVYVGCMYLRRPHEPRLKVMFVLESCR